MEKEVSSAINLAVTMLLLSVLISMVAYTITVGNGIKMDLLDKVIEVQEGNSTGQLNSLAGGDAKVMPKVSAFYIVSKEYVGINEIDYQYENKDNVIVGGLYKVASNGYWTLNGRDVGDKQYILPQDILDENGLDGKVSMQVERVDRGMFKVIIRDVHIND